MKKILDQFKEVMKHSSERTANCFGLNITESGVSIIGASKKPLPSQSGIIVLRLNNQFLIRGMLDGNYYESSTLQNIDSSKPIKIGVDRQKTNNTKIYVLADSTLTKFCAQSNMTTDDSVSIFWEIETQACLTSCVYDPIREEIIREVVSAGSEPSKKFLRAEILQKLQPYATKVEQSSERFENNDDTFEGEVNTYDTYQSTVFQK